MKANGAFMNFFFHHNWTYSNFKIETGGWNLCQVIKRQFFPQSSKAICSEYLVGIIFACREKQGKMINQEYRGKLMFQATPCLFASKFLHLTIVYFIAQHQYLRNTLQWLSMVVMVPEGSSFSGKSLLRKLPHQMQSVCWLLEYVSL